MDTLEINGAKESKALVFTVFGHLEKLLNCEPLVFYELVQLCRDRAHVPFGAIGERLVELRLASGQDGRYFVHDSVRNITLGCTSGDGMDLALSPPEAA